MKKKVVKLKVATKQKVKPISTALAKIIPPEQLILKRKQIADVIKVTPVEIIHKTHNEMRAFYDLFNEEVKNFLLKKLRKSKDKTIVTDNGKIQYCERHNYTIDEVKALKFLKKHKLSEDDIFSFTYEVVTNNQKLIENLLAKGTITKVRKLDVAKLERVIEEHPELLEFITDDPTEYLRGL